MSFIVQILDIQLDLNGDQVALCIKIQFLCAELTTLKDRYTVPY